MALYRHVFLLDRTIRVEVNHFLIEYSIPEEAEVAESVKCLCLNRLWRPLGIRAEHICHWIREATQEKDLYANN